MEAHDFQTWVMQTYDSKYVEKWEKFLFFQIVDLHNIHATVVPNV